MSKKERKIAGTIADPTLPKTPVEINGKTYNLCFDFHALANAEKEINADLRGAGRTDFVNVLAALNFLSLGNVCIIFACALRTFHAELSYEDALALIDFDVLPAILPTIVKIIMSFREPMSAPYLN